MREKRLTKVQKEILTTLRDVPGARIVSVWRAGYRLRTGTTKRNISMDTFQFLKPWLVLQPKNRGEDNYYFFKPDAEISDAWRTQEIERQRAEAQRKQEEDQRIKEEEYQGVVRRLKNTFAAIQRGDVVEVEYGMRARFEYGGKWYNLTEE